MNPQAIHHSQAWVTFSYASFIGAIGMIAIGIIFAPIDVWLKAYFAMGAAMLVQACITVTKTVRDVHESASFLNRIEDAKTERLLMEIERGKE
jgi:hypothetical protein